jgi:biopolymer transport protein TolR
MAMSLGGSGRQKAEINVTPMIDVLLVLIIIFMVITPLKPRGLKTLVPQAPTSEQKAPPAPDEIVITVRGGGKLLLNQEAVDFTVLHERLVRLFEDSPNRAIFVRGDRDLEFREVAQVIDIAHGAGIDRVALMTN